MTAPLAVSVVIVSRGRPQALRRCVIGVSQLRYDPFEVVVVADPPGCTALRNLPQAAHIKLIPFDEANISAARNAGIAAAAGDVVAFVDDDAVPEPTWLHFLAAPFARPEVAAAGGFVRGRNGISWQWRARTVDGEGRMATLELTPDRATVLTAAPGRAVKTEGTNMALRRSVLARMGGFDPRYRFYLDETDLNLRLAEHGARTALVPLAQVHHGFASSARRRADRTPTDLHEIGASWAVFLDRHCPPDRAGAAWARLRAGERRRALGHMVAGAVEPRDVRRLMASLDAGYAEGRARAAVPLPALPGPAEGFRPFPVRPGLASATFAGRVWSRRRLRRAARAAAAAGNVATVICLSPTAAYHRVRFTGDGVWEQSGGLFGRSERTQNLFSFWRFAQRVDAEKKRVSTVRGPGAVNVPETAQSQKNDKKQRVGDRGSC